MIEGECLSLRQESRRVPEDIYPREPRPHNRSFRAIDLYAYSTATLFVAQGAKEQPDTLAAILVLGRSKKSIHLHDRLYRRKIPKIGDIVNWSSDVFAHLEDFAEWFSVNKEFEEEILVLNRQS